MGLAEYARKDCRRAIAISVGNPPAIDAGGSTDLHGIVVGLVQSGLSTQIGESANGVHQSGLGRPLVVHQPEIGAPRELWRLAQASPNQVAAGPTERQADKAAPGQQQPLRGGSDTCWLSYRRRRRPPGLAAKLTQSAAHPESGICEQLSKVQQEVDHDSDGQGIAEVGVPGEPVQVPEVHHQPGDDRGSGHHQQNPTVEVV